MQHCTLKEFRRQENVSYVLRLVWGKSLIHQLASLDRTPGLFVRISLDLLLGVSLCGYSLLGCQQASQGNYLPEHS